MTRQFWLLAAAAPLVSAFSNTAPLLTWASSRSDAVDALPPAAVQVSTVLDGLLVNEEICDYDAVVLVQQRGLHASDLRNLSPESSGLPHFLRESPSARSFEYLVNEDASASLPSRGREVAEQCQSRLLQYSPGDSGVVLDRSRKHVINLILPDLTPTGGDRREAMQVHESALASELAALSSAFAKHLVIYTGIPISALSARASSRVLAPGEDTLPEGGILKRYQLLTPGLITILLIVFFILIPVLFLGINALAGIQNPIKMDMPKTYNAQERKNQ